MSTLRILLAWPAGVVVLNKILRHSPNFSTVLLFVPVVTMNVATPSPLDVFHDTE
jgi:hypothetical protein